MNLRGKQIAFDFDGTITQENIYPNVGAMRPLMDKCIQQLYNDGALLQLNSIVHILKCWHF